MDNRVANDSAHEANPLPLHSHGARPVSVMSVSAPPRGC
jgi:hypothetical protein